MADHCPTANQGATLGRLHNHHGQPIRLAASVKWFELPAKMDAAVAHGLAVEFTPDQERLHLLPEQLQPCLASTVACRHHAFFPGLEMADVRDEYAQRSLALHQQLLERMAGLGEQVVTVHVGLDPKIELCPEKAVKNLSCLVEKAGRLGITVSLENLRRGKTSNPHTVLDWARRSGASITLDIGHVLSSEFTRDGGPDIHAVIELFAPRLEEVHYYERELDRHYPPEDMSILGPVVDALLTTRCSWWTIELSEMDDILRCRQMVWQHGQRRV